MFGIGAGEFILIIIVGLIVFGPSKLPEAGRSLGKLIREFRKAQSALTTVLNEVDEKPAIKNSPPKSLTENDPAKSSEVNETTSKDNISFNTEYGGSQNNQNNSREQSPTATVTKGEIKASSGGGSGQYREGKESFEKGIVNVASVEEAEAEIKYHSSSKEAMMETSNDGGIVEPKYHLSLEERKRKSFNNENINPESQPNQLIISEKNLHHSIENSQASDDAPSSPKSQQSKQSQLQSQGTMTVEQLTDLINSNPVTISKNLSKEQDVR